MVTPISERWIGLRVSLVFPVADLGKTRGVFDPGFPFCWFSGKLKARFSPYKVSSHGKLNFWF